MIKKILKHFHGLKSIKHPSVIYFDYESSSEKTNDCENNSPQKHFTTDVNNHKPCCLAMSMKYGYNADKKNNKYFYYRHDAFVDEFCKLLKTKSEK